MRNMCAHPHANHHCTCASPPVTRGRLSFDNFVVPFFGHQIMLAVAPDDSAGGAVGEAASGGPHGQARQVSVYGSGESNYYYQLRRFVDDVAVLQGAHTSSGRFGLWRGALGAVDTTNAS